MSNAQQPLEEVADHTYRFTLQEPNRLSNTEPIMIQLLHEGRVVYTTQPYPFGEKFSEEWRTQYENAKTELRNWLKMAYSGYIMHGL